jgi:hypothetical protein
VTDTLDQDQGHRSPFKYSVYRHKTTQRSPPGHQNPSNAVHFSNLCLCFV